MWAVSFLLTAVQTARAEPSFEDTVRRARASSLTAQMGEEDLTMARHRMGQSVARLMPQISASDMHTYRYNNPDKYTFSLDSEVDCDEEFSVLCLPFAITDGQITLPDNSLSNIFSLSGALPVSSTSITGVLQQRLLGQMTHIQVGAQDERLVLDLVSQYAELQYTVGALVMYEESLALSEETLQAVQGKLRAGTATDLDLAQAELDVDEAALAIAQIERALPTAMERLELLSGQPAAAGVRVCPFAEDVDTGTALDLEAATTLAQAETELRLDRLGRTSARLGALPTLTVMGGLSYSGNGADLDELTESFIFDNWYVGGSLSMTLFDGFGSHHSRREAAASLRKTELDVENTRRDLTLDDQELALELTELAEDLQLSSRALDLQAREVDAQRALYFESGETSFDLYTQSRSLLEQQRLQHLALQRQQLQLTAQRWVTAGQVEALLGQLFAREDAHAAAASCRAISPT